MNRKNILKGIALSISALVIGFLAMAIPFQLFYRLSGLEMNILFTIELAVYFVLGIVFLLAKDKKNQRRERARELEKRHCERVKKHSESRLDFAA